MADQNEDFVVEQEATPTRGGTVVKIALTPKSPDARICPRADFDKMRRRLEIGAFVADGSKETVADVTARLLRDVPVVVGGADSHWLLVGPKGANS